MPASVALVILTGGFATAIMDGPDAVGWTAIMSLALILDAEIYRRLDAAETRLEGKTMAALAAWSFACSVFFAVLPLALWMHGSAAGAAAAVMLCVAGVVRHFGPGAAGARPIAVAGAAPLAVSLLALPALAAMSHRADWTLASVATLGGGALMAYVILARVSAAEAERAMRETAIAANLQHTLARLVLDCGAPAAALVDTEGRIVAVSKDMRQDLRLSEVVGRKLEDMIQWSPLHWRNAFARAMRGEHVRHDADEIHTVDGVRWFAWEALPWRGADGEICGVVTHGRDITCVVQARAAAANARRLKVAAETDHSALREARTA